MRTRSCGRPRRAASGCTSSRSAWTPTSCVAASLPPSRTSSSAPSGAGFSRRSARDARSSARRPISSSCPGGRTSRSPRTTRLPVHRSARQGVPLRVRQGKDHAGRPPRPWLARGVESRDTLHAMHCRSDARVQPSLRATAFDRRRQHPRVRLSRRPAQRQADSRRACVRCSDPRPRSPAARCTPTGTTPGDRERGKGGRSLAPRDTV